MTAGFALTLIVLLLSVGSVQGETWRGLTVAPEKRCAPYERSDYAYRSTPLEMLLMLQLGGVYAPYTGRCFRSRRQTDVEHMIALSEAHDSGMCGRSMMQKVRFANDPLNLTLAGPVVNGNRSATTTLRDGCRKRIGAGLRPAWWRCGSNTA